MKKHAITAAVLFTAALFMASSASAQVTANKTATNEITVTVASDILVDVKPENMDFTNSSGYGSQVAVGEQILTSDDGFDSVDVENIGSENIDSIWVNASMPDTNPFGTGVATQYDAGNFFQVKPDNQTDLLNGDPDDYHFVNRKEFAWTSNVTVDASIHDVSTSNLDLDVPSYIHEENEKYNDTSSVASTTEFVEYGRFRAGDEWFTWAIPHDSGQTCTGSADVPLLVGDTKYNSTQTGTVDFTVDGPDNGNRDWTLYQIESFTGSSNYGIADDVRMTVDNDNDNTADDDLRYDVLTNCGATNEQPHVIFTRYNINAQGASDLSTESGAVSQYLLGPVATANPGNMLQPGDQVTIDTAVQVPYGVADNQIGSGTFRVKATFDRGAQ